MKRLLLLCICATGCSMYWGGDDVKNDDCGDDVAVPANNGQEYRDPSTGSCIYEGGGGGEYCGCGPCAGTNGGGAGIAVPDWGQCGTSCDALDEADCITTSGCHAAYIEQTFGAPISTHQFYQCWQTAPLQGADPAPGSCSGLDAQTCSERDSCSMLYSGYQGSPQGFDRCFDETSTSDPGSCTGTIQCGIVAPSCPANSTPGITNGCWSGFCIPNAQCGGHDPGHCYDQVTCDVAEPSCPAGTLPGIIDGCYSGYCIPTSSCEAPACESLTTENACTARSDCSAVYTGMDCTCTMTGCTCENETFKQCDSLVGGL